MRTRGSQTSKTRSQRNKRKGQWQKNIPCKEIKRYLSRYFTDRVYWLPTKQQKVKKQGIYIINKVSTQLRIAVVVVMMTLATSNAMAQYDPYFAHYFDMHTSVNPAAAGNSNKINAYGIYNMTMTGFENAPQTMMFAGDMPVRTGKTIHGLGLSFMNDKVGLFNNQRITAEYALRMNLKGGHFSVGVSMGMISAKFKGSDVELGEDGDEVFSKSDIDGNTFDVGIGVFYSRKNWYAGISATHLTAPTVTLGEYNQIKVEGNYYAVGGMDFQLPNPTLKVLTSAIVRTDLVNFRGDLTARLQYQHEGKMMYAGVGYSPTNSVTLLIGGKIQNFLLGYSFEAYTNALGARNGSHEIFVGYQTDIDLGKKGKNKHQTTRTL